MTQKRRLLLRAPQPQSGWHTEENVAYKNVSYEAAVTHLHLVCFAYALLIHVAITGEGAKGKGKPVARLSSADLQNEVRRMVWDDLSEHLKQFTSGTQIIKELERLLMAT
jgi:hypothetical protein